MIQGETIHPLPEAYERATGYRPHPSTCHRHRIKGCYDIRLETVKCGGKRMTSVEAVHRFNKAVTRAADGVPHKPQDRTPWCRKRDIDCAERELGDEGF